MNLSLFTQPAAASDVIIMTSLELVDFINAHRKETAEAAGEPFPSKGYAKLGHNDFMKKVPDVLGKDAGNFSHIYRDSMNREQDCYRFPKREACLMAMSYSYEIQARVFDRMTELEDQRRIAPQSQPATAIEQDLRVVGILADLLRVAPSGRITMAQVVLEQSAPHLLPALPGYAVDAPPSAIVSGSSMPTLAVGELLKRHGFGISAMNFNKQLAACGMLEQQTRQSRGGAKSFWSVTQKGSDFGKNITSNKNSIETQPHWYIERFPDLLLACGVA